MRSGCDLGDRLERVAAVGDGVDLEARVAQRGLEHRAQVVLVVDEQESGGWPRDEHGIGACERDSL